MSRAQPAESILARRPVVIAGDDRRRDTNRRIARDSAATCASAAEPPHPRRWRENGACGRPAAAASRRRSPWAAHRERILRARRCGSRRNPPAARPGGKTPARTSARPPADNTRRCCRPGMADRREQHEAAGEIRRFERHRQAEHAGERMDDDDRPFDALPRQRRAHGRRLAGGRSGVRPGEAVAPAMAGTIDGEEQARKPSPLSRSPKAPDPGRRNCPRRREPSSAAPRSGARGDRSTTCTAGPPGAVSDSLADRRDSASQ